MERSEVCHVLCAIDGPRVHHNHRPDGLRPAAHSAGADGDANPRPNQQPAPERNGRADRDSHAHQDAPAHQNAPGVT